MACLLFPLVGRREWQLRPARSGVPEATKRFAELVAADGFAHLQVSYRHALRAGDYTINHRDPFDRMLAAQSELERMVLVTRDPAFSPFACKTLW